MTCFEETKEQIEKHMAVLCVIVLLLEAIKFVTTLAMLGMAVIREGITGLLAVPRSTSAGKDQKESEAEPHGKRAFN